MLATVDPDVLGRLWFPLGEQTKDATRAEALAAGLAAAGRAESQEACFLAGADYRDFLGRHGAAAADGPVVDESGKELGRHDGYWRFTPGQRRGLGVAAAEPLYALRTDARTNTVVAGPRRALAIRRVEARGCLHTDVRDAVVKLRYRSPAVAARVGIVQDGFSLDFAEPAYAVARGQTAVLYEGDIVVGAGTVSSASAE
jgi:tRNA-specific 2-thiouridylase